TPESSRGDIQASKQMSSMALLFALQGLRWPRPVSHRRLSLPTARRRPSRLPVLGWPQSAPPVLGKRVHLIGATLPPRPPEDSQSSRESAVCDRPHDIRQKISAR